MRAQKAVQNLVSGKGDIEIHQPIPIIDFFSLASQNPERYFQDIFQAFPKAIHHFILPGKDEYPGDPQSVHYVKYDTSKLFVEGRADPFLADRLVANRFMYLADSVGDGGKKNKFFVIDGPPATGKTNFMTCLIEGFQEHLNSPEGQLYETVWRLKPMNGWGWLNKLSGIIPHIGNSRVSVPCLNQDHPILMVPLEDRKKFLDDLLGDSDEQKEFKKKFETSKAYDWVYKEAACPNCDRLAKAILKKTGSYNQLFSMLYAQPMVFDRRTGEGIKVFSPDNPRKLEAIVQNLEIQKRIDKIFGDSGVVQYFTTDLGRLCNGLLGIMDVKDENIVRLNKLHNVFSDGRVQVEATGMNQAGYEISHKSIKFVVMNPSDKEKIENIGSLWDRAEVFRIPYILDYHTEIQMWMNQLGSDIAKLCLPEVLENFAKVVVASRLKKLDEVRQKYGNKIENNNKSACEEWIDDRTKYGTLIDEDYINLKMDIYTGKIPEYLNQDDFDRFDAAMRKKVLNQSEIDGDSGFTGRQSLEIIELFKSYLKRLQNNREHSSEPRKATMSDVHNFFHKACTEYKNSVNFKVLEGAKDSYDYEVMIQVKDALYKPEHDEIDKKVLAYLFSISYSHGVTEYCPWIDENVSVSNDLWNEFEVKGMGNTAYMGDRHIERIMLQKTLITETLEKGLNGRESVINSDVFERLKARYTKNEKRKVLDPLKDNENFRKGIKAYRTDSFHTFDKQIKKNVPYMIENLMREHKYTENEAKRVAIYVYDHNLADVYRGQFERGAHALSAASARP